MIDLYNSNTGKEQIIVFSNMFVLLEKFDTYPKKTDNQLDAQGGNPTIKKKSLAKPIELKEFYDLYDIWRVRNTKSTPFTFTKKHSSDSI